MSATQSDQPLTVAEFISRYRGWFWTIGILALFPIALIVHQFVLRDYDFASKPQCHKAVMLHLEAWRSEHGQTIDFPNINGDSTASLKAIEMQWDGVDVSEKYNYVPGLRNDDPPELVLMYLRLPTRWQWHGQPGSIFAEKEWIIVPIDFTQRREGVSEGEENERLSTAELRERLKATLDYLKKNNRTHADAVAREHGRFLASIDTE